jgi:hypothetical protein
MAAAKRPANEPRSAAEWETIVQSFKDRQEESDNARVKLETAIGLASATGDVEAVRKHQKALDERAKDDEATRLGLAAAEVKLAEAVDRELAEDLEAEAVELTKSLDIAAEHIIAGIDAINAFPASANAARAALADAKPRHLRLAPRASEGLGIDRSMRPEWPWGLWQSFIMGRCGGQFGERRSVASADDAEAKLRAYVDRMRIKPKGA